MLEELRKRAEERRKKMEAKGGSTKLEGCQLAWRVSDPSGSQKEVFCCELIPPPMMGKVLLMNPL